MVAHLPAGSVITALVDDDVITIARDEHAVALPLEAALQIAADTLRMVLDDHRIRNHRGQELAHYLGADEEELRRILSRISYADGPTFTHC